jgi:SPP1 family predicted phage head-tail adaptor
MNIGQMDRQLTLFQKVSIQASNGEEIRTWQPIANIHAEKTYFQGQEEYQAEQKQIVQPVKFRIRWRPGVTALLRLLDRSDNRFYEISAVAEIGRRQGYTLSALQLSVQLPIANLPEGAIYNEDMTAWLSEDGEILLYEDA